jgi:transcriptional regulator with PAS, ATPase and Fis domain
MKKLIIDENLKLILDSISEGINIIDSDSRVIFGNKVYCDFIGLKLNELVGKELKKIRPNAKLPDVIKYGTALLHVARKENGEHYFVNMYPIRYENEIIGGISVVTFVDKAFSFKKQIEELEKKTEVKLLRINKVNSARHTFDSITSVSDSMKEVKSAAMKVSKTDMTVLLESETGTGKELFAHAIHNHSLRKNEVFIAINCANFRGDILDSELFGYVEGAFTGAKKGGKMGLFEAADKGTLFLDEISEMDISLQSKLLRALQERKIRPVGSVTDIPVDVRIICASNANLWEYVKAGKFRADLYYRLSSFPIRIPPLRERVDDIPVIVREQLKKIMQKLKTIIEIDSNAMNILCNYHWPGNVRELVNVLEFSSLQTKDGIITADCMPESLLISEEVNIDGNTLSERVKAFEKREIMKELARHGDNTAGKRIVAKKLGISLATLYNKTNN